MRLIKVIITLFTIVLIALSANAQEKCNNAKDDDNDGLIDLKDPECSCKDSLPNLNYIKNGSFEHYTSCPTDPSYGVTNYNVRSWFSEPLSSNIAYFNSDCLYTSFLLLNGDSLPPPYPIPDGRGYILLSDYRDSEKDNKYYAATCLQNPLLPNKKYSFECNIGFSPADTFNQYFPSPFNLTLFGNPACSASRFTNFISHGCPLIIDTTKPNYEWEQLGAVKVYGHGTWIKVRIDFIPSREINVLLVGAGCSKTGNVTGFFCYADNFSLSEEENFNFKTISVNNDCSGKIQLTAPPTNNAAYQWYKDSIAIIGATAASYNIPVNALAGVYNVRLQLSNTCIISSPVSINPGNLKKLFLGKDTTLCSGESLQLYSNIQGVKYRWQDGSTASSIKVTNTGVYSLTVTDAYGCSTSSSIKIDFKQCSDCAVEIPTAFTPNGDGKNDRFKVLTNCSLIDNFSLIIYNRWGQKIFETKNVTEGWNGTWNAQPLSSGTYIYMLKYKKYGLPDIVHKKGTISLIQ